MFSMSCIRGFLYAVTLTSLCYGSQGYGQNKHANKEDSFTNAKDICAEVSSFTPNFCSFHSAQQRCKLFCDKIHKEDKLTCGVRKPLSRKRIPKRFPRIVGGQASKQGEWPWHVSLRVNGTQWCAGSILSERFILTAAHCFVENATSLKPGDWYIYAGDHKQFIDEDYEQKVRVKKLYLHPRYKLNEHKHQKGIWLTAENDIAIMELENPIQLADENKGTLCLPDNNTPIGSGYECHVVGWGHTSFNGKQPDHLMHALVLTVSNTMCNMKQAYNDTVDKNNLICAGYELGGIDACHYDSGGSMVCMSGGRWYSTGIVSTGFECARPHAYGLYTRVATNKKWIIDTLLKTGVTKPY